MNIKNFHIFFLIYIFIYEDDLHNVKSIKITKNTNIPKKYQKY